MQLKLVLINIVQVVLIVLMMAKGINSCRQREVIPDTVQAEKQQKRNEDKILFTKRMPPEKIFNSVAEKNLFSPERRESFISEKKDTVKTEIIVDKKIQGKTIVLYGVVLADKYRTALISNPEVKPGEKKSIWVKQGDRFSDMTVAAIGNDSIMFDDGESIYKVMLHEKERKQRSKSIVADDSPTVISTPKQTEKTPRAKKEELTDDGDVEEISTPFGTVKRRK